MRWRGQRESSNVEDRRGMGGRGKTIALGGGGLGLIVMVVVVLLCGGDLSDVLRVAQQQQRQAPQEQRPQQGPQGGEDRNSKFSKVVLASTEDTWNRLFRQSGSKYRVPKLVLVYRTDYEDGMRFWGALQWGRSIALATRRFTLIFSSSASSKENSRHRVTLRRLM